MTTYTPDDFKNARFAEHPNGGFAARLDHSHPFCWEAEGSQCYTDAAMAADGWVPVREADGSDRVAGRQKLLDHIASLDAIIRRRNDQIERQENQIEKVRAARDEAGPLSLDVLRNAWENAEVPTFPRAIREGDEVIGRHADSLFSVRKFKLSDRNSDTEFRILSRAPQPDPWVELAGVLHDELPTAAIDDVDLLAKRLYSAGIRVTGGDET